MVPSVCGGAGSCCRNSRRRPIDHRALLWDAMKCLAEAHKGLARFKPHWEQYVLCIFARLFCSHRPVRFHTVSITQAVFASSLIQPWERRSHAQVALDTYTGTRTPSCVPVSGALTSYASRNGQEVRDAGKTASATPTSCAPGFECQKRVLCAALTSLLYIYT